MSHLLKSCFPKVFVGLLLDSLLKLRKYLAVLHFTPTTVKCFTKVFVKLFLDSILKLRKYLAIFRLDSDAGKVYTI